MAADTVLDNAGPAQNALGVEASGIGVMLDGRAVAIDLSFGQVMKGLVNSVKIRQPQYNFAPTEGWTKWCIWAAHQGKTARILRSLSKNVISFGFNGKDEKIVKKVRKMAKRIMLQVKVQEMHRHWNIFGKTYAEPVWKKQGDKIIDIEKLVIVNPDTITVVRDSQTELMQAMARLKDGSKEKEFLKSITAQTGDTIVCFFQYLYEKPAANPLIDPIMLMPEDLIAIFRYDDPLFPNGVSLLQENYDIITNKFLLEDAQMMIAKGFSMPRMVHTIPRELWNDRQSIKDGVREGHTLGPDIFVPEGVKPEILEPKGTNTAMETLNYTDSQFISSFGFADSFTESDSSNRSVGEVQLEFFERDITPERELFGMVIEERILLPYMKNVLGLGKKKEANQAAETPKDEETDDDGDEDLDEKVQIEWAELKSEDELSWANVLSPLYADMGYAQKKAFWEYVGLPVDEKEWKEQMEEDKKNKEAMRKIMEQPQKNPEEEPKDKGNPDENPEKKENPENPEKPASPPPEKEKASPTPNPFVTQSIGDANDTDPAEDLLRATERTRTKEKKTARGIREELQSVIERIRNGLHRNV